MTKAIRISDKHGNLDPTNHDALREAIHEAIGRAGRYCVASVKELGEVVAAAEARLAEAGVPLAARVGVEATHLTSAAYKYSKAKRPSRCTKTRLARRWSGWVLVEIEAIDRWPGTTESLTLELTQRALEGVVRGALRECHVEGREIDATRIATAIGLVGRRFTSAHDRMAALGALAA